jgi:predicted N-acetyltransferase YhbS
MAAETAATSDSASQESAKAIQALHLVLVEPCQGLCDWRGVMTVLIRPETQADAKAIHDLTRRAFAPMPYAGGDEQDLVDALRAAGALSLSLVAELEGAVVGQVTLSPATHEAGAAGWYALGPVSAEPTKQFQGIGSTLIRAAIDWMRQQGASGCILVGSPAYYSRFGFTIGAEHCPYGQPAQFFQVLSLAGEVPGGRFAFHPLFGGHAED